MASKEEVLASVRAIVAELAMVDETEIQTEDRLRDDLGLDSLQEMELMSRLSEEYEVDPDMEDVMSVRTVVEVADFLLGYLKG